MYDEIKELKEYCDSIGVVAKLEDYPKFNGYAILFNNGSDCIQHDWSYGSKNHKVEFGYTGQEEVDFKESTLENAKAFVKRYKKILNTKEGK